MPFGKHTPPEVGAASQFKPGQSGNPKGNALDRHSTRTVNEWVNNLLNDESFELEYYEQGKLVQYKGAPIKAIIRAQTILALQHTDPGVKTKSSDLLLKYGAVQKTQVDLTSNGETISQPMDVDTLSKFMGTLKDDTKTNEGNA